MNKQYTIIELTEDISSNDILSTINNKNVNNMFFFRTEFAYRILHLIENNKELINKRIAINNIFNIINYFEKFTIDTDNPITMSKEKLIELSCVKKYQIYRQILFDAKIFKKTIDTRTNLSYKVGIHSTQVELHNEYKFTNSPFCLVVVFNDRNNNKKINLNTDRKYNSKFEKAIIETKIDIEKAIIEEINNHIINNPDKRKLLYRLNNIISLYYNTERSITTSPKCDRITHSLSNVSKISRVFLTYKNKKYYNIDLSNSQPLFLSLLMKNDEVNIDYNYINNVQNNQFYSQFYSLVRAVTNISDEEEIKKLVKKTLYKNIFFGFNLNKKRSILDDIIFKKFETLYPNVFFYIKNQYINNKDYNLAIKLQKLEAELFNNIEVTYSPVYFTLYDSIYFIDFKDKEIIENQINKYFSEKNIKCSTKFC